MVFMGFQPWTSVASSLGECFEFVNVMAIGLWNHSERRRKCIILLIEEIERERNKAYRNTYNANV